MDTFRTYMPRKAYQNVKKNGDRLAEAEKQIEWERFKPIIKPMYTNDTPHGGRPNTDEAVMVKLLLIQQWYGLSDIELERQTSDRISFQRFLGWPEQPPDYSTVWSFRERLAATRTDELVWAELQRQLDEKGLKVRKGVAQDASIIEADPGQSSGKARGDGAKSSQEDDAVGNIHFQLKISVWGDNGVA